MQLLHEPIEITANSFIQLHYAFLKSVLFSDYLTFLMLNCIVLQMITTTMAFTVIVIQFQQLEGAMQEVDFYRDW